MKDFFRCLGFPVLVMMAAGISSIINLIFLNGDFIKILINRKSLKFVKSPRECMFHQ